MDEPGRHFIVTTAGHVDHGKSSLVQALTGMKPDRLAQEKARGMTIEPGFTEMTLFPTAGSSGAPIHLSIIDVPGHQDLVRNMIAGASGAHAALLVIATNEGWMPQTEEHLQILTFLNINRAIVVVTKSDLSEDLTGVIAQLKSRLEATALKNAPVIPVSTRTGEGLPDLRAAFFRLLDTVPAPTDINKPRLFIDRAFAVRGIGTVVTGSLLDGCFEAGQQVIVRPGGETSRIRSLQSHNQQRRRVWPGERAALNLAGLELGSKNGKGGSIQRGALVTATGLGAVGTCWEVLARSVDERAVLGRPNRSLEVAVHWGTACEPGRLTMCPGHPQPDCGWSFARIQFISPVSASIGDRFVLRDLPRQLTVGGGIVLQPNGGRLRLRKVAEKWQSIAADSPASFIRCQLREAGMERRHELLANSRFSSDEITEAVASLEASGEVVMEADLVAFREWWENRRARKVQTVNTGQSAAAAQMLSILDANGLRGLSLDQIARSNSAQTALRFLVATGQAVDLGRGVIIGSPAFAGAEQQIRAYLHENEKSTAGELRQLLGTTRRVIIPLLERLARTGVTRRENDYHLLRSK